MIRSTTPLATIALLVFAAMGTCLATAPAALAAPRVVPTVNTPLLAVDPGPLGSGDLLGIDVGNVLNCLGILGAGSCTGNNFQAGGHVDGGVLS
ncbi:hypothetical protein [Streptomyces hundungensis]|uniref:hypothetical protein n=1 Tax=Streptomyces hundungensis TaxID=1077946 RepID=UPI0031EBDCF4